MPSKSITHNTGRPTHGNMNGHEHPKEGMNKQSTGGSKSGSKGGKSNSR